MSAALPRLRADVDVVPANQGDETVFILYDRSGITDAQLAVSPAVAFVASLLDGSCSRLDMQDHFREASGGETLEAEDLEDILCQFEDACFLEGDRFDSFRADLEEVFRASPVREAFSAGSAYDDDPDALRNYLDDMMASAPPHETTASLDFNQRCPRGVIVPHIDYVRGAPAYGQLYSLLRDCPAPDVVVLIGTAHTPLHYQYSFCAKDFATPLGLVAHAADEMKTLRNAMPEQSDTDLDLFAHRGEHSIELQTVWLRHLWGDSVRIIPILAGSMEAYLQADTDTDGWRRNPQITSLVDGVQTLINSGQRVLVMASADLAHVGPRFGDEQELTEALLTRVEEADRDYLSAVASGDPTAGLTSLQAHEDAYHVCGTGCIHALGAILEGTPGELLGYHQASTPEMQQAVTYAAMVFA